MSLDQLPRVYQTVKICDSIGCVSRNRRFIPGEMLLQPVPF